MGLGSRAMNISPIFNLREGLNKAIGLLGSMGLEYSFRKISHINNPTERLDKVTSLTGPIKRLSRVMGLVSYLRPKLLAQSSWMEYKPFYKGLRCLKPRFRVISCIPSLIEGLDKAMGLTNPSYLKF